VRDFELIREATEYAWRLVGTPYIWGGNDPMRGFDCSGFVIEVLKAVGRLPYQGDWIARDLYGIFPSRHRPERGCLVFWGGSIDTINHVEFCLNEHISIGASGGGSKILALADAVEHDAFIKPRPILRPDDRDRFYNDPFFVASINNGRYEPKKGEADV